jgi:hypothetical protein
MNSLIYSRLARGAWAGYRACFLVIAVGLLLTGSPAAFAQSIFANLSGTVTDTNGAVIQNAKVSIQNSDTKVVRQLVTNNSGFFSATQLPTGTYRVTAEAKGFQKWEGTGIVLQSADDRSLNIPLKIGAENETVKVTANSEELVISDSGARMGHIDSNQLQKLSLVGRNSLEFLKTLPGSALQANGGTNRAASNEIIGINGSVGGASNLGQVSINGQSGQALSLNQDGQNVMDPGSMGGNTPVNANPDMISELTVQSSNYGADNAKGPVVINSVTKSGGSQFHGDIHFLERHYGMNAEDSFNKLTEVQNPDSYKPGSLKGGGIYSYPGFSVTGPVVIPGRPFHKIRNKLFFSVFAENYRQLIDGGLTRAYVPTTAMLNGDFSGMSALTSGGQHVPYGDYNWLNRLGSTPTAGSAVTSLRPGCTINDGVMSAACLASDNASQILMKAGLPAPTSPTIDAKGFNYVTPVQAHQNDLHPSVKLDINVSENTKAYVNWSHQSERAHWPMGLWTTAGDGTLPAPSQTNAFNNSDLYTANFVHVFSPTMTVEARYGYTHMYEPGSPQNPSKVLRNEMGFPQKGVFGNANAPVALSWGSGISTMGDIGHDYRPNFYSEKGIPSAAADLTKVFNTHTAKFGGFWEHVYNVQDAWAQYMGVFDYSYWDNSSPSGNVYADELMGIGFHYTEQAYVSPTKMAWDDFSFYGNDHWKLNRRVTVDYGIRLEHFGVAAADGPYGSITFNPKTYQAGVKNSGISYYGIDKSVPKSGGTAANLVYSPRFGAQIDVYGNGKTRVGGGWGIFRYFPGANQGPADSAKGSIYWNCSGGSDCSTWEQIDSHINTGGANSSTTTCAAAVNCAPAIVLGVESDYTNSSVGVIDPKNQDQPYGVTYSLNLDQELGHKFLFELAYVGNHTNLTQDSVNINAVPIGAMLDAAAVTAKCSGLDATLKDMQNDSKCQQLFRPYSNYQDLNANESAKKSQYDSMQVSLKRNAGWALFDVNYTWAKNLGNSASSGAYKDYGVHEYWSILNINRGNVLNASYVLSLPGLRRGNHLVRGVTNGWQFSGISTIQSGAPVSASSGYDYGMGTQGTGAAVQMLGTPNVSLRPVLTCDPRMGLKKGQYVNPDCFAAPTTASNGFGNGHTGYIPLPKYWNSDLTLIKNFSIGERQSVELRFAGFNFLNHALTSFSNGDSNLKLNFDGTTHQLTNGNGTSAANGGGACPGPTCKDFGYADYTYGHRILEAGAKFSF